MPDSPNEKVREQLTGNLQQDESLLHRALNCPENQDVVFRHAAFLGFDCCLVFLEGMADAALIGELILKAALVAPKGTAVPAAERASFLLERVLAVAQAEQESDVALLSARILGGMTVLLADGATDALCLETRGFEKRSVGAPLSESVVAGAQEGFVESLRTNTTLMHRYVQSAQLVTEYIEVGEQATLRLAVMHLKGVTREDILAEVKRRLRDIHAPSILGIGQVQQLIEDNPMALLPQMLQTERPDRTASALLDGQIVILAENSPCALIAPVTVFHFLHTSDDAFLRWQYGSFLRLVRLIGVALSLYLPASYIALTLFHAHLIPMALLSSIAETRAKVPFPIVSEVMFMEVSFFLINEAGTRIPSQIGTALGIVGALILGQAAVSASVISPILIIVIALTGLGNYAIPNYPFSLAVILCRMGLEAAAALLGVYGIVLFSLVAACRLARMRSFGVPYCAPIAPRRPHNPDILLRLPLQAQMQKLFFARGSRAGDAK